MSATRETVTLPCTKCGGSGVLPEFRGVDGGRCWACGGTRQRTILAASARARRRRQAARAVERAAYAAANATDREQSWARAREALRPLVGDRVDLADNSGITVAGYPDGEARLKGHLFDAILRVRDGADPAAEAAWIRDQVEGAVLWINRVRRQCIACEVAVGRGQGIVLEVGNDQWVLCSHHRPTGLAEASEVDSSRPSSSAWR